MFDLTHTHPRWHTILQKALAGMDKAYLVQLSHNKHWLPGKDKIFNAFSLPPDKLKHILFGESPYPREISANGYAFWDNAVHQLWSPKGLSKEVNRATSLRNFIKMLLLAEEKSITCDKSGFIQTLPELFQHLQNYGFLLLNATPVYRPGTVSKDAKAWQPFMKILLEEIYNLHPETELIFFGKIAQQIEPLLTQPYPILKTEHPYNISFIYNPIVLNYFRPFKLLAP